MSGQSRPGDLIEQSWLLIMERHRRGESIFAVDVINALTALDPSWEELPPQQLLDLISYAAARRDQAGADAQAEAERVLVACVHLHALAHLRARDQ
jgi:hypothetical protein